MRIISIIILISINYLIQAQNIRAEYFKHLIFRETPYSFTKGRIPISKEKSEKENHYKLSYNSNNQLILIEYKYGDVLINRKRAGIMDGFRNIATKTKIEYLDYKEIRTFYDINNIQCPNPMNVYKEVYEYNKKGKRTSVKFYDKYNKLTNNTWNISEYNWTTDTTHSIIEKRKNKEGVYVPMRPYYKFMSTLYKYTNEGTLISMNHVDIDNNLIEDESGIAIDKAEYDNNLNLIGFKFYNSKSEPVIGSFLKSAGGKIEYDINGNCIKYSTINLDDSLMISRHKAYDLYQFNINGDLVELSSYDTDNKLLRLRGVIKIKYTYDDNKPFKHLKTEYYHNE